MLAGTVLTMAAGTALLGGVIGASSSVAVTAAPHAAEATQRGQDVSPRLPAGWRARMLAAVNAVRADAGVPPLRPCAALRRAAQDYAMVMASRDHFGHVGPDGRAPGDRIRSQGYAWKAVAENIAAGQVSIDEVMAAWIASPGHYANLISPAVRHVGLGYAGSSGSTYGAYWVQEFGRGRGC